MHFAVYLYFCVLYFIFASVFVMNKRKCINLSDENAQPYERF